MSPNSANTAPAKIAGPLSMPVHAPSSPRTRVRLRRTLPRPDGTPANLR
nr:hypothetical protein [Streptomyces acidiscabies]